MAAQNIPQAHVLSSTPYYIGAWSANEEAGTYPPSMLFQEFKSGEDPSVNSEPIGNWMCSYNSKSRSRFVGLQESGIGMINSGSEQDDSTRCGNGEYLGGRAGVVTIALNTLNTENIELSWKIRMIEEGDGFPTPRDYRILAQYRISESGEWVSFPTSFIYNSLGKSKGEIQEFFIQLPDECEGEEYVQVRWKYYQHTSNDGGSRPFLAIDDIKVVGENINSTNRSFVFASRSSINTLNCIIGSNSQTDSFMLSGVFLKGDVKLVSSGNFLISSQKTSEYSNVINITPENGVIQERVIYIQKKCSAANVENGAINITGTGINKRILLKGEGYNKLFINEIMSSNFKAYYQSQLRDYPDWIEIYNPNDFNVLLRHMYLSDDKDNLRKYRFSLTQSINSKSYRLFFATGEQESLLYNQVNFSLSLSGETIFLVGKDGVTIIDSVTFPLIETDQSYGREINGDANWVIFTESTPNSANGSKGSGVKSFERSKRPVFSKIGGKYEEDFLLKLSSENPEAKIYYTIDGSIPTIDNLGGYVYEYKQSYPLQAQSEQTDFYYRPYRTFLYTNAINTLLQRSQNFWISDVNMRISVIPFHLNNKRDRGLVIKAICIEPGKEPSPIVTQSYFFGEDNFINDYLPIVSLTLSEKDLIGFYEGISVAGVDYEKWRFTDTLGAINGNVPANYKRSGRNAEIAANIEIYENGQNYNEPIGVRIHGATSRSGYYKSMRFYPRAYYGKDKIHYPIFQNLPYDDYKRVVYRNTGNSNFQTYFKDAFLQRLVRNTNLDYQEYRPTVLYLNGEYWGIYDFRERIDINYFQRKYGFEDGKIDYLKGLMVPSAGDNKLYRNLYDLVRLDSMISESTYNTALNVMDVSNYIDYYSFLIYVANMDWPFNNIGYWRYKIDKVSDNAPYGLDGRFRWVVYDLDHAFYYENVSFNTLKLSMFPILNVSAEWSTILFRNLLNHSKFKNDFIIRHSDLLNTYYKENRVLDEIKYYKDLLEKDMPNQFERWKNKDTIDEWYSNIELLEKFAQERPRYCREHMKEMFSLQNLRNIHLDVDNSEKGFIKINTVNIDRATHGVDSTQPYPWTGLYFEDLPITLIPIPRDGYKFSYWEFPDSTSFIDTLQIKFNKDVFAKAYFEIDDNYIYYPEPAIIKDCPFEFTHWAKKHVIGEKPEHMEFYYTRYPDSKANGPIDGKLENIRYDHESQTRINGLNEDGISLINTGGANDNYFETRLGAVAVAVKTEDIPGAYLSFTAGTVKAQSKKYSLRLQYRLSDKGEFYDFYDVNNQLVEYHGADENDHSQRFEKIELPKDLLGKKYVQLVWRYYYNGAQVNLGSNARDELRIDDIKVQQKDIVSNIAHDMYKNTLIANSNSQTFQWYTCANDTLSILTGENKKELIIEQPGYYSVEVDYGECKYISDCEYFFVKEHKDFYASIYSSIYPNPSNGTFDLIFDEEMTQVKIIVLDVSGKSVNEKFFDKIKTVHYHLNHLPNGVYLLDISTLDGRKSSQKFVVNR